MTCDRVAIIKRGRIATQGTIDDLLAFFFDGSRLKSRE